MACPLSYNLSVTGDCSNIGAGAVQFDIIGTAPTYTVSGASGVHVIPLSGTTYLETGLTAGDYLFSITDSCLPSNTEIFVNVYISSGTCVSITGLENTNCGLSNGALTAQTSNYYGSATFSLYGSSGLISSFNVFTDIYVFDSLSADTYYVISDDGGGCTGKSETCIVKSSSTLDYGFYVVNDTPCNSTPTSGIGAIYVTGLTGVAPYTYLWSNGLTTSSITGLTAGTYNVTVTDSTGCSSIKATYVDKVESPGVGAIYVTPPSCFAADGEVTIVVTGGTAPFYYSSSTGSVAITLSNTHTFSGVPAGLFSISVTDAGLCKFTTSTFVATPSSFSVVGITTTNSNCNDVGGSITAQLSAGSPPYTYSLTDSSGNTQSYTTSSPTWVFNSLSSGVYTLTITDSSGTCTFINDYTITNTIKFIVTGITTGTTCNLSNGAVTLGISGGSGTYRYEITGQSFVDSGLSSYTYTNLSSGSYVATITDLTDFCVQYLNFNIAASTSVDFTLFPVNTSTGNDGEIYAFITSGTPPFILNWSSNVGAQTGLHITGLTAGTYSLTVIDDSGCTQTRNVEVGGYSRFNTTQTYNICTDIFADAGLLQRGPKQMLIEGFYDLTSGDTNCILNQAIFTIETILSGETKTQSFYTGTTLNDSPSAFLWGEVVTELLQSYGNVGEVISNVIENNVQIFSDCDSTLPLMDVSAIVNLKISYDISCEQCDGLFAAVLNDMSLGCETNVPPIEYSLTFNYSITGGSGNYELQFYSGSTWVTFYSFTGPINGIPSVDVGPVIADITNVTSGLYNWRIHDIDYNENSPSFASSIPNCAT